jgi:2,3-bisphosphoglycerate-independent phosphoglycerate mutase
MENGNANVTVMQVKKMCEQAATEPVDSLGEDGGGGSANDYCPGLKIDSEIWELA